MSTGVGKGKTEKKKGRVQKVETGSKGRKGQKEREGDRGECKEVTEKRMMMKGSCAILSRSFPNKATISLKPTIISPNSD